MSLKRLNGLAILSIKRDLLANLECKDLINNFTSQKARKIDFKLKKKIKTNFIRPLYKFCLRPFVNLSKYLGLLVYFYAFLPLFILYHSLDCM